MVLRVHGELVVTLDERARVSLCQSQQLARQKAYKTKKGPKLSF
jgi:hypothetical protein